MDVSVITLSQRSCSCQIFSTAARLFSLMVVWLLVGLNELNEVSCCLRCVIYVLNMDAIK